MKREDIEKFANTIEGKIFFDYDIRKLNWFNIGGKTKIFFKPNTLQELINFLKLYKKRGKIFLLGAGSNILFNDKIYDGVVIKLGNKFSNISQLSENLIIAGSAVLDKKLSEFAKDKEVGGLEFLSGIPGTVGGGIRMNSGCFQREFKDVLASIQILNYNGEVSTVPADKINFSYRETNFSKENIFLSASFKGKKKNKELIEKEIKDLKNLKETSQPSKVKTSGSTFKNPIEKTSKKVWELIKESVSLETKFGDAEISPKHCNFFVNKNNASFKDMKKLIFFVKEKVKVKTGIDINLEIILVE